MRTKWRRVPNSDVKAKLRDLKQCSPNPRKRVKCMRLVSTAPISTDDLEYVCVFAFCSVLTFHLSVVFMVVPFVVIRFS